MHRITRWRFAGFDLDAAAGTLARDGSPVKIGRQAFRALSLLVSKQGELVTRDELQREIWGDRVHVDFEHGLNVCIRQVRLALADDGTGASAIVITCPREGYRLGVAVKPVADTRWGSVRLPRADLRWADPARLRLIGAAAALVVASVVLTASYSWITQAPTPAAFVRPPGGGPAPDGPESLLTAPNMRPVPFARAWPTGSSEAYAWYWRGRGYYDRTTGRRPAWALPYFETAASLDPTFALAHASLAVSYLDRASLGIGRDESLAKARQSARRALALGPTLAETQVALAEVSYRLDEDPEGAEQQFVRAVALDGQNAYARQRYAAFLHAQRRFDAALDQLRLAEDLDPLSVMTNWQIANELYYSGQYEAAMAQANHTLEIDPSHAWSFRTMGQSLEATGRMDEAIAAYLKAGQVALGHLGRAYALSGRRAEARELLDALIRQPVDGTGHNGVAIAFILTGLGEHAKATEWLERLRDEGVRLPFSVGVEAQWDRVRASSSFEPLVKSTRAMR